MRKISAIICAYNEEITIKEIVTTVCDNFFNEVIVVNDGSADRTAAILAELCGLLRLKCMTLPGNKGKGYAMETGVEILTSEIIVFVDVDLSNLTEEHLIQLITSVFNKEADMVFGQPTNIVIPLKLNPFKVFIGQRKLRRKDVIPVLDKMIKFRFGVETLLNLNYNSKKKGGYFSSFQRVKAPDKIPKNYIFKSNQTFFIQRERDNQYPIYKLSDFETFF